MGGIVFDLQLHHQLNGEGSLHFTAVRKMPPPPPTLSRHASVSMNLIRADTFPVGSEIWTEDEADDGEGVWMLAQVVRQQNTLVTIRKKSSGEELEIDLVSNCSLAKGLYFLKSRGN